MNPSMHARVMDYFKEVGLTDGFIAQFLYWSDTGKASDKFIVFRPNGGTAIRNDLGSDYFVLVDVISAKRDPEPADQAVQIIIDHIQKNPMPNNCIGHIENIGGIPAPVLTSEERLVYRLQFSITFGE